ncbi:MAG: hypothetical protein H0T46_21990 [Deltaproteobacteria bacterium]|nr:hypothetical protein [Deltaproteobacteria bacterium]
MKRLGYVKLSSFGLVLTPEGRVLSMRPAVLEDALGGRIVGWQDSDLAAAELEKWEPARPAPAGRPSVATRAAAPRPPIPTGQHRVVSAASASVVIRDQSLPATVAQVPTIKPPVRTPVAPAAVNVAPEPVAEEDDWEWTIAIARARAAAEEVVAAAAEPPPLAPGMDTDAWPNTETLTEVEYNDYTSPMNEIARTVQRATAARVVLPAKVTPARPMPVVTAPQFPRAKSPSTVIPIPRLPSVASTRSSHVEPIVRGVPSIATQQRRFAKGTNPHVPKAATLSIVPEPTEDTVPHLVLPPAPQLKRASRG